MDSQVHCQVVASVGVRTHMPTVPISTPQEKHSQAHFSHLNSVKCVTTKYMMVSVGTSTHMPTDIKHFTETHIDMTTAKLHSTHKTSYAYFYPAFQKKTLIHMTTAILHSREIHIHIVTALLHFIETYIYMPTAIHEVYRNTYSHTNCHTAF